MEEPITGDGDSGISSGLASDVDQRMKQRQEYDLLHTQCLISHNEHKTEKNGSKDKH